VPATRKPTEGLIQLAHNELSKLGAVCRTGSQNDGNENSAYRGARFVAMR
jgi:hypothetical protein